MAESETAAEDLGTADDPIPEEGGEAPKSTDEETNTAQRLESIEGRLDSIEAYQEQYVKEHLLPRVQGDDELLERIHDLEDEVATLKTELDSVVGIADGESSSPKKRAVDLAMILIRRAKARVDEDRYLMWYRDVQDALADHGHGPPVYKQWAYDAMADVATADGFAKSTTRNRDGREVQAVTVNLAELPDTSREAVSNDIITGAAEGGPQTTEVTASE